MSDNKEITWNNAHRIKGKDPNVYRKDEYINHLMENKVKWDGR